MISVGIFPREVIFNSSAIVVVAREYLGFDQWWVGLFVVKGQVIEDMETKFVFPVPATWMLASEYSPFGRRAQKRLLFRRKTCCLVGQVVIVLQDSFHYHLRDLGVSK